MLSGLVAQQDNAWCAVTAVLLSRIDVCGEIMAKADGNSPAAD